MGEFAGGGAENLRYTSYPYQRLRAAVYAIREEGFRVAQNEWADLKRLLNERIGTLHVVTAELPVAWESAAGNQAVAALRAHRGWMVEFARVAAWNEHRIEEANRARVTAIKAMQDLDAQPGGPRQPGGNATPRPAPGPNPGPGTGSDPAGEDWRQPYAARIAHYVYSKIAVAAASMAKAPAAPKPIDTATAPDGDRIPGDGPVQPPARSTPSAATPTRPSTRTPSESPARQRSGDSARQPAPRTSSQRSPAVPTRRTPESPPVKIIGSPAGRDHRGDAGGVTGGDGRGRNGAGTNRVAPSPGVPRESVPAHRPQVPGKVLGGLRPSVDTGTSFEHGPRPPGHVPPPHGPHQQSPRLDREAVKPGYEQGEPDTFRDKRPRNPRGGTIGTPPAGATTRPHPTDHGRGVIGAQKRPVEQHAPWEVPDPVMPPSQTTAREESTTMVNDGTRYRVKGAVGGP